MSRASTIPPSLRGRPFTRRQAIAAGLSADSLRGSRFRTLFRGVYVVGDEEPTFASYVVAALFVLPSDAVISHVTALWWYGVHIGSMWPLHFSTNTTLKTRHDGVRLHRRRGKLRPVRHDEREVSGPERAFVDSATLLPFVLLVMAGDALMHAKHTSLQALGEYCDASHIHGVVRARRTLPFLSEGAESPMETVVRLMLVLARLPMPECNPEIWHAGRFVARCDLVFRAYKVIVEYDGEWHERSRKQRQRDIERREALEALGWTVIVVVVEDLKDKREIVRRVHRAIVAHGYAGPKPVFNIMWQGWFERD
ncbi:DUF559 domain-containing protein [Solicola gregarius]|uniref:Very short patch repair endonuclease n=1 Tax=Solicola gregarius TaxID=2908642 RepID=A0AA46TGL8_9ACTN|nr:DUF559 domain-containing protein [Solicola gregarius]UYM04900.1 very short patch repair endonuclease [Solicola gregarius]